MHANDSTFYRINFAFYCCRPWYFLLLSLAHSPSVRFTWILHAFRSCLIHLSKWLAVFYVRARSTFFVRICFYIGENVFTLTSHWLTQLVLSLWSTNIIAVRCALWDKNNIVSHTCRLQHLPLNSHPSIFIASNLHKSTFYILFLHAPLLRFEYSLNLYSIFFLTSFSNYSVIGFSQSAWF